MRTRPHRSRYPVRPDAAAPGQPVRTRTTAHDAPIRYLGRRLLPLPDTIARQSLYTVRAGDRIDLVAASLLGDPTLYWLLLEANGASDPHLLCAVPGRTIAVPASIGQPASGLDHPRAATRTAAAAAAAHARDAEERL